MPFFVASSSYTRAEPGGGLSERNCATFQLSRGADISREGEGQGGREGASEGGDCRVPRAASLETLQRCSDFSSSGAERVAAWCVCYDVVVVYVIRHDDPKGRGA